MLFNFLYAAEEALTLKDQFSAKMGALRVLTRAGQLEAQKTKRDPKDIDALLADDALCGSIAKALQTILQKDKSGTLRDRILLMNQSCCNVSGVTGRKAVSLSTKELLEGKGIILEREEFLAAGSMARVALARYQGTLVVAKIINPFLKGFDLAQKIVETAHVPTKRRSGICNTQEVVQRLMDTQKLELDLLRELGCMQQCWALLSERYKRQIHIPRVFEAVSEKSILVMEFIDGLSIEDICLRSPAPTRKAVAATLLQFQFNLLSKGLWLTDLNIGSAKVTLTAGGDLEKVCMLDFGAFQEVGPEKGRAFIEFILHQDRARFTAFVRAFGHEQEPTETLRQIFAHLVKPFARDEDSSFAYNAGEAQAYAALVKQSVEEGTEGPTDSLIMLKWLGQLTEMMEVLLQEDTLNVHAIVREATQEE